MFWSFYIGQHLRKELKCACRFVHKFVSGSNEVTSADDFVTSILVLKNNNKYR